MGFCFLFPVAEVGGAAITPVGLALSHGAARSTSNSTVQGRNNKEAGLRPTFFPGATSTMSQFYAIVAFRSSTQQPLVFFSCTQARWVSNYSRTCAPVDDLELLISLTGMSLGCEWIRKKLRSFSCEAIGKTDYWPSVAVRSK